MWRTAIIINTCKPEDWYKGYTHETHMACTLNISGNSTTCMLSVNHSLTNRYNTSMKTESNLHAVTNCTGIHFHHNIVWVHLTTYFPGNYISRISFITVLILCFHLKKTRSILNVWPGEWKHQCHVRKYHKILEICCPRKKTTLYCTYTYTQCLFSLASAGYPLWSRLLNWVGYSLMKFQILWNTNELIIIVCIVY